MKQVLWYLAFGVLRWSGVPFIFRQFLQYDKVTIITYHSPRLTNAKHHFRALRKRYNIIPLAEYVRARTRGCRSGLPPKSLIITMDDGHRTNFELKPLLKELNIPLSIFLCSGLVGTRRHYWWRHLETPEEAQACKRISDADRIQLLAAKGFRPDKEYSERDALSDVEIEELKPYVDFQAHTVTHPILPACTDEVAEREIRDCKSELEAKYGLSIYALALPNGDYSERDLRLAGKFGYRCALTQESGFNDQNTDLFRLRRIALQDDCSINELLVKTSGLWGFLLRFVRAKKSKRASFDPRRLLRIVKARPLNGLKT
jgi:peptidoglycan/xylan/chitin deacetylase (PgdA/CDA1 family)